MPCTEKKAWQDENFAQSEFLFFLEKASVEIAEKYLLLRKDLLKGEYFDASFLKKIKAKCSPLAQTVILRVPLAYYLDGGKSKYYSTAAKHLSPLFELAEKISAGRDVICRKEYFADLAKRHAKKYSFGKYFDFEYMWFF